MQVKDLINKLEKMNPDSALSFVCTYWHYVELLMRNKIITDKEIFLLNIY